jgi:hypothetical protein
MAEGAGEEEQQLMYYPRNTLRFKLAGMAAGLANGAPELSRAFRDYPSRHSSAAKISR